MIKIALVDDEAAEREKLGEFFRRLSGEMGETVNVVPFSGGNAFLQNYNASFQLVCLDIDMPEGDGLSAAKLLRERDASVVIVFITNMAQLAIRGYEVQARDFLVKPVMYPAFALKMSRILRLIRERSGKELVLQLPDGMVKIPEEELLYVEIRGHELTYHTPKGSYKMSGSLRDCEEKLAGRPFFRCNNCYLVNLGRVRSIRQDEVQLGEDWLKISRPRKKEFSRALLEYLGGTGC